MSSWPTDACAAYEEACISHALKALALSGATCGQRRIRRNLEIAIISMS